MNSSLIVYHSRTGNSRTVAKELNRRLDSDCEEVLVENQKLGLLSYLSAGWAALTRNPAPIRAPQRHARHYPLVIIGGPNWAGHLSDAVLSWLDKEGMQIGVYAAWVTQGGSGAEKVLKQLEEEIGYPPVATLILTTAEIANGSFKAKVAEFADRLMELLNR